MSWFTKPQVQVIWDSLTVLWDDSVAFWGASPVAGYPRVVNVGQRPRTIKLAQKNRKVILVNRRK